MTQHSVVPLSEIAIVTAGTPAPQGPNDFVDTGIPFIRMQDVGKYHHCLNLVESVDHVSEETAKRNHLRLFPKGSLLIPKSGASVNLNHRAMLARDAYVVSHLAVAIPDTTRIVPEYLYYWSLQYDPRSQAQVTSLPSLPLSQIKEAKVPLLPIVEQHRIVDILKRADGIRRLRKQAQVTASQLIPALFIDMFGDPVINPNSWKKKLLKVIADIGSGVTKGRKFDGQETVELPYLAVANVQDGHLNLDRVKSIRIKPSELEKYRVLPGDFLMTEGGDPDKLGRGAIWNGEIQTCLHQNHIFRVRCNQNVLLPEYLRSLVGSHYGKGYFLRVAKQTTGIASINKTQLGNFPVLVPPIEMQNEFVARLKGIQSIIRLQEAAHSCADSNFLSFLSRAFLDVI